MAEDFQIILAGGGTGGHLYPGIAVAEVLRNSVPKAKILFLCTTREIDQVILGPTGFESIAQPIVPPHRSIGGLLKFWRSWRDTRDQVGKILSERKPAVVVGLGGYAAGVAVKHAALAGISTVVLNPDVIPGKANQYLMKYASAVCCQFESTAQRVPEDCRAKLKFTGCPIRQEITDLPARGLAAGRLGIDPRLFTLVITGASQGAMTINEAMSVIAPKLDLSGWQILHLSGREHGQSVRAGYANQKVKATVIDFTPAMADVWAVADLCVSRSGASSCAELTACGIPSILLPYPFHKDLHQRANAKVLADGGAAILLDDEKDQKKNAEKILPIITALLSDGPRRQAMSIAAKKLGRPDAAQAVAAVITQMAAPSR